MVSINYEKSKNEVVTKRTRLSRPGLHVEDPNDFSSSMQQKYPELYQALNMTAEGVNVRRYDKQSDDPCTTKYQRPF
jgi:hypothetical protein